MIYDILCIYHVKWRVRALRRGLGAAVHLGAAAEERLRGGQREEGEGARGACLASGAHRGHGARGGGEGEGEGAAQAAAGASRRKAKGLKRPQFEPL